MRPRSPGPAARAAALLAAAAGAAATPSAAPSPRPSVSPSAAPSASPIAPGGVPSAAPSVAPSASPVAPGGGPSAAPSASPVAPGGGPSAAPSAVPSGGPVLPPSAAPSAAPTLPPSLAPYNASTPSASPYAPTGAPTESPMAPTAAPTAAPGDAAPSASPEGSPTAPPVNLSAGSGPSAAPSQSPGTGPNATPTAAPAVPTRSPGGITQPPTGPPAAATSVPTASRFLCEFNKVTRNHSCPLPKFWLVTVRVADWAVFHYPESHGRRFALRFMHDVDGRIRGPCFLKVVTLQAVCQLDEGLWKVGITPEQLGSKACYRGGEDFNVSVTYEEALAALGSRRALPSPLQHMVPVARLKVQVARTTEEPQDTRTALQYAVDVTARRHEGGMTPNSLVSVVAPSDGAPGQTAGADTGDGGGLAPWAIALIAVGLLAVVGVAGALYWRKRGAKQPNFSDGGHAAGGSYQMGPVSPGARSLVGAARTANI
eukprot:TRINITY_DN6614_c0_g1_i1.p1 TRINITY_DN6614_c0_g1~~TRINITY_DN6614_c0_g1_i1.p1  ORF type:complete len:509 (+),score=85.78 TRINITY_DN6614_c0_g1_i1:75-1529(+)